eukprot:scaffold6042_cov106-Cylindrotheca_fusiformis.AAC.2
MVLLKKARPPRHGLSVRLAIIASLSCVMMSCRHHHWMCVSCHHHWMCVSCLRACMPSPAFLPPPPFIFDPRHSQRFSLVKNEGSLLALTSLYLFLTCNRVINKTPRLSKRVSFILREREIKKRMTFANPPLEKHTLSRILMSNSTSPTLPPNNNNNNNNNNSSSNSSSSTNNNNNNNYTGSIRTSNNSKAIKQHIGMMIESLKQLPRSSNTSNNTKTTTKNAAASASAASNIPSYPEEGSFQAVVERLEDPSKQVAYLMLGAAEVIPGFNVRKTHPYSYFFYKKKGYKHVFQANKTLIVQEIKRRRPDAKPNQNNRSNEELMEMLVERWPLSSRDRAYVIEMEREYRQVLLEALNPKEVTNLDEWDKITSATAKAAATATTTTTAKGTSATSTTTPQKRPAEETQALDTPVRTSRRMVSDSGSTAVTTVTTAATGSGIHDDDDDWNATTSSSKTTAIVVLQSLLNNVIYSNLANVIESLKRERFELKMKQLQLQQQQQEEGSLKEKEKEKETKKNKDQQQQQQLIEQRLEEIEKSIKIHQDKMAKERTGTEHVI